MERVFWIDSYEGHAVDALNVTRSIKDLYVSIEKLEKDNNHVVGLKVTEKGVWIIVDNSEGTDLE